MTGSSTAAAAFDGVAEAEVVPAPAEPDGLEVPDADPDAEPDAALSVVALGED